MSKNRRSFSPEYMEQAARAVVESVPPRSASSVARELQLNEQTLRNWVKAYRKDHPEEERSVTVSEHARLEELEKEVRELRLKAEFFGKAAAFFASEYR